MAKLLVMANGYAPVLLRRKCQETTRLFTVQSEWFLDIDV
jgi:hypothetical protein